MCISGIPLFVQPMLESIYGKSRRRRRDRTSASYGKRRNNPSTKYVKSLSSINGARRRDTPLAGPGDVGGTGLRWLIKSVAERPSSGEARARRRDPETGEPLQDVPRHEGARRTSTSTSAPARCTPSLGHNGSGKSTLIKVLSGYHHPDPGASVVARRRTGALRRALPRRARPRRPRELRPPGPRPGAGAEHDRQPRAARRLRPHRVSDGCAGASRCGWPRRLLAPFAVDFDITQPLSKATPVERTIVAIAAALQGWDTGGGGVLVLDEPTAVLPPGEVATAVHDRAQPARRAVRASSTCRTVSTRSSSLADRVTVLRNGEAR